ncbi:MAG: serine/threonine-protein kinase [Planctomycetota bacterium]
MPSNDRQSPPSLSIGDRLEDFHILQTLGRGAFASVYLARQSSMNRLVALKVSHRKGDEPRALAQFDHPNIVRVYDERLLESPPLHLLYMQFLPGGTLADVINRRRHLGNVEVDGQLLIDAIDHALLRTAQVVPEQSLQRDTLRNMTWPTLVAWMGIQLARALDAAHARGIQHQDVKPANVLLSAEGTPKLVDFNVSSIDNADDTDSGRQLGGSIAYMSPEQLQCLLNSSDTAPHRPDKATDLYCLGVLLTEFWTGERPFKHAGIADSWEETLTLQLEIRKDFNIASSSSHQSSSSVTGKALERLLSGVIQETLAFDPARRIGSAAELERRLVLALHPDAAVLFDPDPNSWLGWAARQSPWLVAGTLILVPNAIAGVYGYLYNYRDTLSDLFLRIDGLQGFFRSLATTVNCIAFPLAFVLVILFTRRVVQGLQTADAASQLQIRQAPNRADLDATLSLAHRAAFIGAGLWCLAAFVYPVVLVVQFDQITRREIGHFVLSHMICGGVAATYPFFGIAAYALVIWYPRLVRHRLSDPEFENRIQTLIKRCERFLFLASIVPLLGAALLLASNEDAKDVMLVAIIASALGLFAAFSAYRMIVRVGNILAPVMRTGTFEREAFLSTNSSSIL